MLASQTHHARATSHRALGCCQPPASRLLWCSSASRGQQARMQLSASKAAQATATTSPTSTSSNTSSEAQQLLNSSIAVPIEQAPPAAVQQHQQGGFSMVGPLLAAAVAAGLAFKKLRSNDPSKEYLRSMQMDELDPEIIAQARARRSRERANHRLDLDDIELPENHPWATRKPVTAEQEAAIQARLQVRPRRGAGPPGEQRSGPPRTRQLGRE